MQGVDTDADCESIRSPGEDRVMGKGRRTRASVKVAAPPAMAAVPIPVPDPPATCSITDHTLDRLRRDRATQWWLIWLASLAVIAIGWRYKQFQLQTARQQIAEWKRACEPLALAEQELAADQARWRALVARDQLAQQLQPRTSPVAWLGWMSKATGHRVLLEEFRCTVNGSPQLELRGITRDDTAAEEFVRALKTSGVFAGVEMKSLERVERLAAEAREFTAHGQLQ
jgi:hypothetical protein